MNKSGIISKKRTIYGILIFAALGLMLLNFLGVFFLKNLENVILQQLKQQLNHLGKISARSIIAEDLDDIYPGRETVLPALSYQQLLYEIKNSGDLENIILLSPMKTILVDHRVNYHIGDSLTTLALNDSLFQIALQGEQPIPEMAKFANEYFLTSFTPIIDPRINDVCAVLIIETSAHFFSTLIHFKRGLFSFGWAGLIVLVFFAAIITIAFQQLLKVREQLSEQTRLAQLGQMAAMVAHEIRNPLSIIKGSADILKKKYIFHQDELFDFIPEETNRLNRLINDFLQFSKKKDLTLQAIHPAEQIKSLLQKLDNPQIEVYLPDSNPKIMLDSDSFTQVLLNILDNAQKSLSKKGKIIIQSTIISQRPPRYRIQIRDNGSGISRETLSKIFTPFFSTRATGSGLGMTITKQLVEQMKGHISIESKEMEGTIVTLEFPLLK